MADETPKELRKRHRIFSRSYEAAAMADETNHPRTHTAWTNVAATRPPRWPMKPPIAAI